jgi:hypothetical protein
LIVVAVLITVVVGLSSYGDIYLQSASGILGEPLTQPTDTSTALAAFVASTTPCRRPRP